MYGGQRGAFTEELLKKRWAGVDKAPCSQPAEIINLVRLTLSLSRNTDELSDKFRTAFKSSDTTFAMSGNDLEVTLLAGSVLVNLLSEVGDEADLAALAILSASAFRTSPPWIKPFISHASAYLDERLAELRQPPDVAEVGAPTKKLKKIGDDFSVSLRRATLRILQRRRSKD